MTQNIDLYNSIVEYRIWKNTEEECFIELTKDKFRTRIEFNWSPPENFRGIAVSCNYDYKGQPIGFLKDNGKLLPTAIGHETRPIFNIDETYFQAGPTLVENFEINKSFSKEGFSTNELIAGLHAHIGNKKYGNFVVGFTKSLKLYDIANKYKKEHSCQYAMKLPGFKRCAFYFASSNQVIKIGTFPIAAALIFESRIENRSNLNSK